MRKLTKAQKDLVRAMRRGVALRGGPSSSGRFIVGLGRRRLPLQVFRAVWSAGLVEHDWQCDEWPAERYRLTDLGKTCDL